MTLLSLRKLHIYTIKHDKVNSSSRIYREVSKTEHSAIPISVIFMISELPTDFIHYRNVITWLEFYIWK